MNTGTHMKRTVVVQSLSCVWLFATPWTAVHQAPSPSPSPRVCLNSWLLSRWCFLNISSFAAPFSFCLQSFLASWFSQWVSSLHLVAKALQRKHQSFQWVFRVDFLQDWLTWSPYSPRDSPEASPAPQFESINSLALSFLYDSTQINTQLLEKTTAYRDLCQQSDVSTF